MSGSEGVSMSVVWGGQANDTNYFHRALAEWLRQHPLHRGRVAFDALDAREQSKILSRAQELKLEGGR